jgi:hypothetical protein
MRRPLLHLFVVAAFTCVGLASHGAGVEQQPPIGDIVKLVWPEVQLDRDEQDAVVNGRVVGTILDARHPSELVFFGAARIDATPSVFMDAAAHPAALWRGAKVPRTGTVAQPAAPGDIAQMQLPDMDLDALRSCEPGDCSVKMSAAEMKRLADAARNHPERWRDALQREFHAVIVDRIRAYQRSGLSGLAPFHDHDKPLDAARTFSQLAAATVVANETARQLIEYLARYPTLPLPAGAHEQIYWLQTVQTPKPTIQVLHATFRLGTDHPSVEALVVSRQVFATHYINGSLAITALVRDNGGRRYLLYMHRTAADGLEGAFSGLRRFFIQRRIRSGARDAFAELKTRIERRANPGSR